MRPTLALILAAGLAASAAAQSMPALTARAFPTKPLSRSDEVVRPVGVIYEQLSDYTNGLKAQDYSDFPSFSTTEWDEFYLAADANLHRSLAWGIEQGNSGATTDIIAQVWTNVPDRGGVMVAGSSGGTFSGVDILNIFNGEPLEAGTRYYFSAWVVRGFGVGGSWFWAATQTITGTQVQFWNPGGGFGFGTSSQDGSNIFGVEYDEAFRLEAEEGPPPPPPPPPCYPDCSRDGTLDIRDFFCFQAEFGRGSDYADCDTSGFLDIRDFFCFQSAFARGCP